NFNRDALLETPKEFTINGSITLHGVTKDISTPVKLWLEDQQIILSTAFSLKPTDFNIKIPAIVSNKIAEEVEVNARFSLSN
ncbi:MAG: YceI family protein, partial [Flavobacterium sp.]